MSDFSQEYLDLLKRILSEKDLVPSTSEPTSIGSCFGTRQRFTKEIIGTNFLLENPIYCVIDPKLRKINLPYAVANCIWTLSGSNDLEFINFYNKRGQNFSDDGYSLHGAHGRRLFGLKNETNQINAIVDKLKAYKNSRRAVAQILVDKDLLSDSKDVPCITSVQFLIRKNFLNAFVGVRSQSVLKVMPYDVIVFSFLQQAISVLTNTKTGCYYQNIVSAHIYDNEFEEALAVIKKQEKITNSIALATTVMPNKSNPVERAILVKKWCLELRGKRSIRTIEDLNIPYNLESFWRELALIMSLRHTQENLILQKEIISCINPKLVDHFKEEK